MNVEMAPKDSSSRTSEAAGHFFRYMAEFVEFTEDDSRAIRASALIIEKHLPKIISEFYVNLLKHPQTRKFFLNKDGALDAEYLQLRMYHQANFWRRAAGAEFDDEFASFVHYVGRAHTSRGADQHIYIHEQYVIGMVGFVQNAIIEALFQELDEFDKDLEHRAIKAWNKVCIILLEMLSRAYREEAGPERLQELLPINKEEILEMSVGSYEKSVGIHREYEFQNIFVAFESEIPAGDRKIIEANGISIGIFHHHENWYAIRNSCLHRGGPVATGKLVDDSIICPWHGYTYDLTDGRLLMDPSARLDMYEVVLDEGKVYVQVPQTQVFQDSLSEGPIPIQKMRDSEIPEEKLNANEFYLQDIPQGGMRLVHFNSQRIAVYNVGGNFYATSDECTHAGGPLTEGILKGDEVICPWHDSCFNVITGEVTCPPADEPLKTYRVIIDGEIGRIELAN